MGEPHKPPMDPPVDPAETMIAELAARSELVDVRVVKWRGELVGEPTNGSRELGLRIAMAYRVPDEGFECKFDVSAPLADDEGSLIADLAVAVITSFRTTSDGTPSDDAVKAFMHRIAYVVATPFIREAIQTLTTRLGLEPLTLGLLQSGNDLPVEASMQQRQVAHINWT